MQSETKTLIIQATCTVNADCAPGEVCEDGICVPAATCSIDEDCDEGFVCRNGKCVLEEPPIEMLIWILLPLGIGLASAV